MNKISNKVINFITETMKNRKVELTAREKTLRGIFQGDELSPLLFVIAMIPLIYILRNCAVGHKLTKLKRKINHLIYMDKIKLSAKNEKELETLIRTIGIYSHDIGMDFGMKNVMITMKSRKRTEGIERTN